MPPAAPAPRQDAQLSPKVASPLASASFRSSGSPRISSSEAGRALDLAAGGPAAATSSITAARCE